MADRRAAVHGKRFMGVAVSRAKQESCIVRAGWSHRGEFPDASSQIPEDWRLESWGLLVWLDGVSPNLWLHWRGSSVLERMGDGVACGASNP